MGTSINFRVSDEVESNLKTMIEEIKEKSPRGAEVNNSTIVRAALEDFFKKHDEDKKGIKTYNIPFGSLSEHDIQMIILMLDGIVKDKNFNESSSKGEKLIISLLHLISLEAEQELLKRKTDIIKM